MVLAAGICLAGGAMADGGRGKRAELLEPNSEFAVAELDRKVYVLGGYPADRVTVDTVQNLRYRQRPLDVGGRLCPHRTITAWRPRLTARSMRSAAS
jgi:hypothetical protein